ncbi:uncharacterized protein N7459_000927 [Penicillium hispanicum]|uniref:uncharacterized protein n=1 Tax=Penicillium hispanicum TaxID=1080232 RepID=UPI00254078DB|nr:uncharacterized protein N7459_000927 [Penicillium hispanicum]KAJ5594719.1 hypothetical protein N7459_000927 [Penicillium hispanicum]
MASSAYSQSQLSRYLTYLALPTQYAPYIHDPTSFPKTEEALTTLFRGQITRFPYDNLSVHYSPSHLAEIQPQSIYAKFMNEGDAPPSNRGGYCLECSIFFRHVLRGLGFSSYMTGVRNRERQNGIPQGNFGGWVHIVLIVQLPSGQEYHVDPAFGGDGPTRPMPLIAGKVHQNLGAQEVRLLYDNIPRQQRAAHKVWIYQYRNGPTKDWNSFYTFQEFEWFQEDYEMINRYASWLTLQRGEQWIVKFLRGGETAGLPVLEGEVVDGVDGDIRVVGKIMLVGEVVKLNVGGRTRVIDSFESEDDRMVALKKWFGISMSVA